MLHRREFVRGVTQASIASYLAGIGLGTDTSGSECPVRSTPPGFGPVSHYLREYKPPTGRFAPDRAQTMRFDVVYWYTIDARMTPQNMVIGEVTVKRTPVAGSDLIRFDVQRTVSKIEELSASIICRGDVTRTPVSWRLDHRSASALEEELVREGRFIQTGEFDGKTVVTKQGAIERRTDVSDPLCCQWGLLEQAGQVQKVSGEKHAKVIERGFFGKRISVLVEPSGVRSDQLVVKQALGKPLPNAGPLTAWLQTGPGTVPTHWIVDDEGRPLFVTIFTTSLGLREIRTHR